MTKIGKFIVKSNYLIIAINSACVPVNLETYNMLEI